MNPIRVLVTGAGSAVGQGIIKALHIGTIPVSIFSADIHPFNAALFRTKEALIIPKVEGKGSLPILLDLLRKKRIQVIMVGSEFDLIFFSKHRNTIEAETGAKVIASPIETVKVADDKWSTAEFLRKNGLPYAVSYLPKSESDAIAKSREWKYPILLKSRTGTSSRNIHFIYSAKDMKRWFKITPKPMLQQIVRMPSNQLATEYTCSVFKCKDGSILGPFTARRTMRRGHSQVVEVGVFKALHPLLLEIGKTMDIMGSMNIQLMIGPKGPVPFELNARFSGTTPIRAYFGFNEPEMALRNYFLGQKIQPPKIRNGLSFRYDEQVFLDHVAGNVLNRVRGKFPKGKVISWF